MDLRVDTLLDRLKSTPAMELLEAYDHPEYLDLWDRDDQGPRLYRAFSRALVYQGYPTLALKLARRGLESYEGDPGLGYNIALAYARGGNLLSAEQRLAPLLDDAVRPVDVDPKNLAPRLRMEIIALRGRLYKDRCQRETDPVLKQELARQANRDVDRGILAGQGLAV